MSAVDGVIAALVPEGARVLDLGCGGGELLALLAREKKARGQGVDISPDAVARCLEKGVQALQDDVDGGLPGYPDGAFDAVVLNDSLQEVKDISRVLDEAARTGKRVIVAYPNAAHWRARLRFLLAGRAPSVPGVPWHRAAVRRPASVRDFRALFRALDLTVVAERFLSESGRPIRVWPNLRAASAVAVLSGADHA